MILVVSGISGVGKDEIIRQLVAHCGFRRYPAYTTRSARTGEQHGIDYRFVNDAEMDALLERNDVLDLLTLSGNRYASPMSDFRTLADTKEDVVIHLAPYAAGQLRKAVSGVFCVYVLPPTIKILRDRLQRRRATEQEVSQRFDLDPARCIDVLSFDLFVVNEEGRQLDAARYIAQEARCQHSTT